LLDNLKKQAKPQGKNKGFFEKNQRTGVISFKNKIKTKEYEESDILSKERLFKNVKVLDEDMLDITGFDKKTVSESYINKVAGDKFNMFRKKKMELHFRSSSPSST